MGRLVNVMQGRTRLSFTGGLFAGTFIVVAVQVVLGQRLELATVVVTAVGVAGLLLMYTALRQ